MAGAPGHCSFLGDHGDSGPDRARHLEDTLSMDVKQKRRLTTLRQSPSASASSAAATLVVGLGETGLSCVRFLSARGIAVVVTDSRIEPPGLDALRRLFPEVPVYLGKFDASQFEAASQIIMSPGVALSEPAVEAAIDAGKPVLGDLELFARKARAPVVAITGSNGKSTVTTLVAEMARASNRRVQAGGNLGPPALDLLGEPEPDLYVLEMSSFQLETTLTLEPAAATVLNLSPDHMDRYADLDAYAQAKRRVFRGDGAMVVNLDDPLVLDMTNADRKTFGFTLGEPGRTGLRDSQTRRR